MENTNPSPNPDPHVHDLPGLPVAAYAKSDVIHQVRAFSKREIEPLIPSIFLPAGILLPTVSQAPSSGCLLADGSSQNRQKYATLFQAMAIRLQGNVTNGSAIVTGLSNVYGLGPTQRVEIANAAYVIQTIDSNTQITLTTAVSAPTGNTQLVFIPFGAADFNNFNLPDMRGRVPFGLDNMGGNISSRISTLAGFGAYMLGYGLGNAYYAQSQIPSIAIASGVTDAETTDHTHAPFTATSTESADHSHVCGSTQSGGGLGANGTARFVGDGSTSRNTGGRSVAHNHTPATTAGRSAAHTHAINFTINNAGAQALIIPPTQMVNWQVTTGIVTNAGTAQLQGGSFHYGAYSWGGGS